MYGEAGIKHYGKVDAVPGLCHVATRFFHINYMPLIPLGSEIICTLPSVPGESWSRQTTLSLKSVLIAWVRAALYLTAFLGAVIGAALTIEYFQKRPATPPVELIAIWVLVASSVVSLWLTHRLTRAGYDRAVQLCAELGLDPTVVEQFLNVSKKGREASAAPPQKEPEGWERYS
jgi:hypothetical protein